MRKEIHMDRRLELFLSFAKIGLFTFGGGYAMIALIEDECVEKKKWITQDEMMDITVIAESTPGPIAINCATFTGYRQAGFSGALAATLGMVMPSFLVIYLISMFMDSFLDIPIIAAAFRGIKVCVGILIVDAAMGMIRKMKKISARAFMAAACIAMLVIDICSLRISSISLMLAAALMGLMLYALGITGDKGKGGCG